MVRPTTGSPSGPGDVVVTADIPLAYVWERPETAAELAKRPIHQADLFFDRLDRNGDDVITPDEIPDQMKPLLGLNGAKSPEKITREQFREMYEEMRKRFPQRRPNEPDKKSEKKEPDKAKP